MNEGNSDQEQNGSNSSGNPSLPSPNDGTSTGNGRPSRSVTVSIQYSYLTPNGLANLAFPNANLLNGENQAGSDSNGNTEFDHSTLPRPEGALVLSFSDVPTATPQERLESIVSIAAELAMRRFSDLVSQSKGITKEQFESLPILTISDLPEQENSTCSICYEKYDDEPINILKRSRDCDPDESSVKKQRSESPAVNIEMETQGQGEVLTSPLPSSSSGGEVQIDNDIPTYKHCPVKLPCGHIFGRECLYKWSRLENSCPLCRKPIVEIAPEEQRDSDNVGNNATAEVFERIRQLVYSPVTPDQETSRDSVEQQSQASNSNDNTTMTPQASESQPFTFSRSGIVFLRADSRGAPATTPNNETTTADSESLSGASNTVLPLNHNNSTSGSNQTSINNSNEASQNRGAIQWVPIPITTIRMGRSENAENDSTADESNHAAHGERLRAILDRIFNVTHTENTRSQRNRPAANVTEIPQEPNSPSADSGSRAQNPSGTSTSPRRRSFLQNILRITSRSRNRTRNETDTSNSSAESTQQSHFTSSIGDMFSSGVASYRNQDGGVSTFNIGQAPLPMPPQNTNTTSSANAQNNNSSRELNRSQPDNSEPPEEDRRN